MTALLALCLRIALTVCCCAVGEREMAKMLLHECVLVRRRVLGAEHHETLTSINNLGTLYRRWQLSRPLIDPCILFH